MGTNKLYLYHWERQRFVTVGQMPYAIGRSGTPYVVDDDPTMSRRHCQIELYQEVSRGHSSRGGAKIVIRDLQSQNGTWINGVLVPRGMVHTVKDGDWILVGDQSFYVSTRQEIPDQMKLFSLRRAARNREETIHTWIRSRATPRKKMEQAA